jgi:peptide-methionine (R)-S-oxide reductase
MNVILNLSLTSLLTISCFLEIDAVDMIANMNRRLMTVSNPLKPFYVFLFTTLVAESIFVFILPHVFTLSSHSGYSFFLNGGLQPRGKLLVKFNPVLQSFWVAEIVGLLTAGIYALLQHQSYRLRIIVGSLVSGLLGIYGIAFGFYYPQSYPASFDTHADSALPYLLRANLWLIGGLIAGWLIGKGLESITKLSSDVMSTSSKPVMKMTDEYWRQHLTRRQYNVGRNKTTELPFTGKHNYNHRHGTYSCVACGQQLFSSETKFNSYSGWPSFTDPINAENVRLTTEERHKTLGMAVTEVSCANCGAHLGHLFADGPVNKSGNRYCINSTILDFKPVQPAKLLK